MYSTCGLNKIIFPLFLILFDSHMKLLYLLYTTSLIFKWAASTTTFPAMSATSVNSVTHCWEPALDHDCTKYLSLLSCSQPFSTSSRCLQWFYCWSVLVPTSERWLLACWTRTRQGKIRSYLMHSQFPLQIHHCFVQIAVLPNHVYYIH